MQTAEWTGGGGVRCGRMVDWLKMLTISPEMMSASRMDGVFVRCTAKNFSAGMFLLRESNKKRRGCIKTNPDTAARTHTHTIPVSEQLREKLKFLCISG